MREAQTLIEQSLEMIEFNMNFIKVPEWHQGIILIRGEHPNMVTIYQAGMFDAKQ